MSRRGDSRIAPTSIVECRRGLINQALFIGHGTPCPYVTCRQAMQYMLYPAISRRERLAMDSGFHRNDGLRPHPDPLPAEEEGSVF